MTSVILPRVKPGAFQLLGFAVALRKQRRLLSLGLRSRFPAKRYLDLPLLRFPKSAHLYIRRSVNPERSPPVLHESYRVIGYVGDGRLGLAHRQPKPIKSVPRSPLCLLDLILRLLFVFIRLLARWCIAKLHLVHRHQPGRCDLGK